MGGFHAGLKKKTSDALVLIQVEEHNYANVNSLKEYDDGADLGDFNFGEDWKPPLNADDLRKLSHFYRYASHLYNQVSVFLGYVWKRSCDYQYL